jgi:hypothetical protein
VLPISNTWTSSLLLFLSAVMGASVSGQAPDSKLLPLLPLLPSELSAVMPNEVKGWQLKQATAKNTYTKWLQTRAIRVFESQPRSKEDVPLTVRVKLTDTGRFYPAIQHFRSLAKLEDDGTGADPLRRRFAGLRGSEQRFPDGRTQVKVLIEGRYIVEFLLPDGFRDAQLDLFLDAFSFNTLKGKKERSVKKLPTTYTMHSIDELHPERNRSYQMAIITAEEVNKMLEQILAVDPSIAEDGDE